MKNTNSLYNHITTQAAKTPNKIFLIEEEIGMTMTYLAYKKAIDAYIAHTKSSKTILFVAKGGIVSSVVWFGALCAGQRLIPVPFAIKKEELLALFQMHHPDLLIAPTDTPLPKLPCSIINYDACLALFQINPSKVPAPKKGEILLTTSGSTGNPKHVILHEMQILYTAHNIAKIHNLTKDDICYNPLPFFHINAPVVALGATLLSQGTLVLSAKFSRTRFWQIVKKYKVTWINAVPTIISILLTTKAQKFPHVRFARTGSAPLPPAHMQQFEEMFAIPIIETYGLTEAASMITSNLLGPKKRKPGSVGIPVGVHIIISDKQNGTPIQELPQGEIGEICVQGESLIEGYEHGVGKDSFQDGFFRTGDLGYKDEEGYIYITGRKKDLIIHGGENVFPREVEETLLSNPLIQEAVVVGKPDPIYGENVVAFIVMQTPDKKCIDQIDSYLSNKLHTYKKPSSYIPLESLPRLKNGKIDKPTLRRLAADE